jgi:TonB family protein
MSNLLYSLILHAGIVLLLFFSFNKNSENHENRQVNQTLTAYLNLTLSASHHPQEKSKNIKNTKINKFNKIKEIKEIKENIGNNIKNNTDQLLALLHTAIENAQFYPDSAQQMEREGSASVEFILHINGSITDLNLLHSSGTSSLDEAALEAVKKAAPFQHVEKYLRVPEKFNIDIVFKL